MASGNNGDVMMQAFRPVCREMEQARALFCGMQTPPVEEFQAIAEGLRGRPGKWMRPGLFLLAVRAAGEATSAHCAVAAAMEMVHNASLLHDDVLDGGLVRRKEASANARWGNRAAVLFGDFLLASAFRLTADARLPEACEDLARIIQTLCQGEAMQACLGRSPEQITRREALRVADHKTAIFIACTCRCGHKMGGGASEAAEALGDFGRRLGLAYQALDDVMDVVGDEDTEGKSLKTDLVNARPTLPLAILLERRREEALALLPPRTTEEVETLAGLMNETGALREALEAAEKQLGMAETALGRAEKASAKGLNAMKESFQTILKAMRRKTASAANLL